MSAKKASAFCMILFCAGVLSAQTGREFGGTVFSESQYPGKQTPEKQFPFPRGKAFRSENGHRLTPRGQFFSLIGVKVEEESGLMSLSLYFNDVVDTNSIRERSVFINGRNVLPGTEFLFNRNRHMVRFSVPEEGEPFSLSLAEVRSFDGRPVKTVEIAALEKNSFYKYSPERRAWLKSSL